MGDIDRFELEEDQARHQAARRRLIVVLSSGLTALLTSAAFYVFGPAHMPETAWRLLGRREITVIVNECAGIQEVVGGKWFIADEAAPPWWREGPEAGVVHKHGNGVRFVSDDGGSVTMRAAGVDYVYGGFDCQIPWHQVQSYWYTEEVPYRGR